MAHLRAALALSALAMACSQPAVMEPLAGIPIAYTVPNLPIVRVPEVRGGTAASAPPSFTDPKRRQKLEAVLPAVDAIALSQLRDQGLAGMSVGIVVDGELAYAKGFGFADVDKKTEPDADTIYRIGSISKSFTALALLALRDEGALSLDDPLTTFVPEASGLAYPARDAAPITLRQLATHTAGLPRNGGFDFGRGPTETAIVGALAGFPLESSPGARHEYSNVGYVLLGIAVARAARAPLRDVVRSRITAPLGMTSTSWDRDSLPADKLAVGYDVTPEGPPRPAAEWRVGAAAGAGGLYSSVRDMARYVAFALSAYPPRDAPDTGPIRRSTLREAHGTGFRSGLTVSFARRPEKGESMVRARASTYGFGWSTLQTCDFDELVTHNGGMPGFTADVELLPEHGVGVVALANGAPGDPDIVVEKILDALRRGGGLSRRTPPLAPAFDGAMKKLLAVYNRWDDGAYRAMLRANRSPVPSEKDELEAYRTLHGRCTGFSPLEVISSTEARFELTCERGRFEMRVGISAVDGLIDGFVGITRNAEVPPLERKTIERVVGLIGKWDAAVFDKHLRRAGRSREEAATAFTALRTTLGSCTVKEATREGFDRSFALECERGPRTAVEVDVDPKDASAVLRYRFKSGADEVCPVR